MFKRLSMSASNRGSVVASEVSESVPETTPTFAGSKASRTSLAGVMLSRRFTKRMSSSVKDRKFGSSSAGLIREREPTYRMEPTFRFNSAAVERVLKDVLERKIGDSKYDPKKCSLWIRTMSEDIKERVKMMGFDRYKIICTMVLCQRHDQAAVCSSRCQWDNKNDNYATYTYKNPHLICSVTVYGVYRE